MAIHPRSRLVVESKIAQQRNTIETLKRDGHVTEDAERHLRELIAELAQAPDRSDGQAA